MRISKKVRLIARRDVPGIREQTDYAVWLVVEWSTLAPKHGYEWISGEIHRRELDRRRRTGRLVL